MIGYWTVARKNAFLHLQPKYILFLADFARHKFPEEIDPYADYYYWDIDISDLKQIFSNMDKVAVDSNMDKKKHCVDERFYFFQGCCVYLHHAPLMNADYNVLSDLALKRVKQDLTMHGGQICSSIAPATHLVVVSVLQTYNFDILYKSFSPDEQHYLHDKRLHVVNNKWLEDSVEKQMKLSETAYNLKPDTLEELQVGRSEENVQPLGHKLEEHEEVERPHVKHVPTKRSRLASSSRTARAAPRPVRRTRGRRGDRQAKIADDIESEESVPGECQDENSDADYISKNEIGISDKEQGPPPAASRPVRRTRPRRGNQHAKIDDVKPEESGPCETGQENQELDADDISKMEGGSSDEDGGPPPGAQFLTLGEQVCKGVESNTAEDKPNAAEAMPGEKMVVDPLHAMLLDMILTLGQKRTVDASRVPSGKVEKDPPGVASFSSNPEIPVPHAGTSGVPAPDPNAAPPPKKKNVSYKDVASELLQDW